MAVSSPGPRANHPSTTDQVLMTYSNMSCRPGSIVHPVTRFRRQPRVSCSKGRHPFRRNDVPLELVEARSCSHGFLRALLPIASAKYLGELDQDIGPEIEHLIRHQPDRLWRESLGFSIFS